MYFTVFVYYRNRTNYLPLFICYVTICALICIVIWYTRTIEFGHTYMLNQLLELSALVRSL